MYAHTLTRTHSSTNLPCTASKMGQKRCPQKRQQVFLGCIRCCFLKEFSQLLCIAVIATFVAVVVAVAVVAVAVTFNICVAGCSNVVTITANTTAAAVTVFRKLSNTLQQRGNAVHILKGDEMEGDVTMRFHYLFDLTVLDASLCPIEVVRKEKRHGRISIKRKTFGKKNHIHTSSSV